MTPISESCAIPTPWTVTLNNGSLFTKGMFSSINAFPIGSIWDYDNVEATKRDYKDPSKDHTFVSSRFVMILGRKTSLNSKIQIVQITTNLSRPGYHMVIPDRNNIEKFINAKICPYDIAVVHVKDLTRCFGMLDSALLQRVRADAAFHLGYSEDIPEYITEESVNQTLCRNPITATSVQERADLDYLPIRSRDLVNPYQKSEENDGNSLRNLMKSQVPTPTISLVKSVSSMVDAPAIINDEPSVEENPAIITLSSNTDTENSTTTEQTEEVIEAPASAPREFVFPPTPDPIAAPQTTIREGNVVVNTATGKVAFNTLSLKSSLDDTFAGIADKIYPRTMRTLTLKDIFKMRDMPLNEIVESYGIGKLTAQRWKSAAETSAEIIKGSANTDKFMERVRSQCTDLKFLSDHDIMIFMLLDQDAYKKIKMHPTTFKSYQQRYRTELLQND